MVTVEAAYWLAFTRLTLGNFKEAEGTAQEAAALAGRIGVPVRMSETWVRALIPIIPVLDGPIRRTEGSLRNRT